MKRNTKFLAFLLSAAVTFGSLFALAGPQQFGKYGHRGFHHQACESKPATAPAQ